PVPQMRGLPGARAEVLATALGWRVAIVHTREDGSTVGQVLRTEPAAAAGLAAGRTLTIVVSDGNTLASVPPDLVGRPLSEVQARLLRLGLGSSVAQRPFDEAKPKDTVTALVAGTPPHLPKGASVGLVVSAGPRPRTVPDGLVGASPQAAIDRLAAVQLVGKVSDTQRFSDTVPAGAVMQATPGSGATVPRDTTVQLVVSKGPDLVAVPSIRGAGSIANAIALLQAAGLSAGNVSGKATGHPIRTTPAAGTKVRRGTAVDIVLG
ncbi:MAG: prkC, partial [Acidimicrobiales bacterium]|nr:prkC [Acidimicrobiales bacterium]